MEELEARSSPIPNSEHDWNGYWNHPAEQAARELGKAGVEKTLKDQMKIEDMDREVHFHGNQILETYDYLALQEIASSSQEFGMVAENVMFQEGVDYTEYSIESLPDDEVEYSLDDL